MGSIRKRLRERWLSTPIFGKSRIYTEVLIVVVGVMALADGFLLYGSYRSAGDVLREIALCEEAQNAMVREEREFRAYVRNSTRENLEELQSSCDRTRESIRDLPSAYRRIGAERYARTWNIRNAYAVYCSRRDRAISLTALDQLSVPDLYEIYEEQTFVRGYLQELVQLSVEEGTVRYERLYPLLSMMPFFQLGFAGMIAVVLYLFNRFFTQSIVAPITELSSDAEKIAQDDFSGENVLVENEDELGDLVTAFNRMKEATREHIQTLNEMRALEEQLHREELSRIATESKLEEARLDMLRSQINPHFLFNTLNSISGMAAMEDAEVTGRMIVSLSNIFRYNLQTREPFTSLKQDLSILQDYLYLQKMRFEERMNFEVAVEEGVDVGSIMLPVFLLQPLVENAIVHGIMGREQGGTIRIAVSMDQRGRCVIAVSDDGVGIPEEKMERLMRDLESGGRGESAHIGIGNAYERVRTLYPEGDFRVESREGVGTTVTIAIPQAQGGNV